MKFFYLHIFLPYFVLCQNFDSIQVIHSFQIGVGRIINTLALQENYNDIEYLTGWDFNSNYLFYNLTRLEFKYCVFEKIDILPFWKQAQVQNFNLNYHFIVSNQNGSFFIYPTFGIAYTQFNAFQVMDKNFNKIHQNKLFTQWGLNAGLGTEVHIKFMSIFIDYNMRVTKITSDNTTNIRNVGFSAGIRLFYFQLHWHKDTSSQKHVKKKKKKKLFDLLHDRYHWF